MTPNSTAQTNSSNERYSGDSRAGWFQSHFAVVFGATIASSSAILLAMLLAPCLWASGTSGGLIGEVVIDSSESARSYAYSAIDEALAIWEEPRSNWEVVQRTPKSQDRVGLLVEARRITEGPFASSGVMLTRAEGVLRLGGRRTADEVFHFLASPEGRTIIDPDCDPDDYATKLESISGWPKGRKKRGATQGRLEVAEIKTQGREFVVLNAIHPTQRIFLSKSVLHSDRPGASRYYQEDSETKENSFSKQGNRAVNTFAVELFPFTEDNGKDAIRVRMINYVDMMPPHSSFTNW
eukprot:CAMPEP_0197457600 /NCGR_PEP_ID=MMETSP1175-20131217/46501_1 /TAXON_ID=1003142 /ORGANISM="Triceratium dubium, Strain CCMP147" /LENGTH=294 /DNA_ID=CAMNT_0042992005 /DNA_START=37 /DNA_END=918 /DNA_ORIENTATION=-